MLTTVCFQFIMLNIHHPKLWTSFKTTNPLCDETFVLLWMFVVHEGFNNKLS
jgi:hypothetical protein